METVPHSGGRPSSDYSAMHRENPEVGERTIASVLEALEIQANDILVEIGAGIGYFSLPIGRKLDALGGQGRLYACDYSELLVTGLRTVIDWEELNTRVYPMHLSPDTPDELPFEDEQIETVLWVNALQYSDNSTALLEETARILSPCGAALILDWRGGRYTDGSTSVPPSPDPSVLYPALEAAGFDVHLPLNVDGCNWGLRVMRRISVLL